jgi:hypothetical protein
MDPDDLASLVSILGSHTGTPEECWFCLWDGYGWGNMVVLSASSADRKPSSSSSRLADPVPSSVREGPRVVTPIREYFLVSGPIGAALRLGELTDDMADGPNLMWPKDRSWCAVTDIDLDSTYVGGSADLIQEIVTSSELEGVPVDPANLGGGTESWVEALAQDATATLIGEGLARIETYWGSFEASIEREGKWKPSLLLARRFFTDGEETGSSRTLLGRGDPQGFREEIEHYLAYDVMRLAD